MHLLDIQTAPLSNIRKRSFEECVEIVLGAPGARSNDLGWAVIGALSWTIWLTRNDLVFNDIVCSSPCNNVFKTIPLLTQWARMAPGKREQGWKLMLDKLNLESKNLHSLGLCSVFSLPVVDRSFVACCFLPPLCFLFVKLVIPVYCFVLCFL